MTKLSIEDRQLFESVFKKFEGLQLPKDGEEPGPELAERLTQGDTVSLIVKDSDIMQKALMSAELQIMRSRNPDALASALVTFLLIGLEIGAALGNDPQMFLPVNSVVN